MKVAKLSGDLGIRTLDLQADISELADRVTNQARTIEAISGAAAQLSRDGESVSLAGQDAREKAVAARSIIQTARRLKPDLDIIVRTRYVREIQPLLNQGADEVIPEEFETSIDIFASVLAKYKVSGPEIEKLVASARRDGYALFTSASIREALPIETVFRRPEAELETMTVEDGSPLAGRSLGEIDIRRKYGVTLLEIDRGDEVFVNPGGDIRLATGDRIVVMGPAEARARLTRACAQHGTRRK